MDYSRFRSLIHPVWSNNTPNSISEASDSIATAYHLSNIGTSSTFFGARLINADKDILKTFLELGMSINFYGGQAQSTASTVIKVLKFSVGASDLAKGKYKTIAKTALDSLAKKIPSQLSFISTQLKSLTDDIFKKIDDGKPNEAIKSIKKFESIVSMLDTTKIGYLLMSTGICLYWLSATMSPVPPMPPCISPTGGTQIVIPGLPTPLNSRFSTVFSSPKSTEDAIRLVYNTLIEHQFTIVGFYTGLIPAFPSPIPSPPLLWTALLNIPIST